MTHIILLAAGFLLIGVAAMFFLSLTAPRPATLGVHSGRLAEPPRTANCLSTQTDVRSFWMAPLEFTGSPAEAWTRLRHVVSEVPRTKVVTDNGSYMHVEVTSAVFRFTDDVEFLLEPDAGRIHFRSASRVGRSDLGTNRKRMQRIRDQFLKQHP
ncbi:MAG: DUF1499 domain-containing protein [Planctomycetaceae bacterium]|nr:DUF1499 domain-containing protein [Planctomycetaceae bacterium]